MQPEAERRVEAVVTAVVEQAADPNLYLNTCSFPLEDNIF